MLKLQPAYILTLLIALSAFTTVGECQSDKTIYSSYRLTADSIVKLYYGDELMQFIRFDSSRSHYRTLKTGGGGTITKFTEPLDFEPEMFAFHYYFKHPSFNGDTLNIRFYVYKNHRIMEGFLPEGFIDMTSQKDFKIISKEEALAIAKKSKIKKPLRKYEISLGWEERKASLNDYKLFNETKDIKHIVNGRIVWRVRSHYRNATDPDESPYAETFLINAVTGEVIGIEHDAYDWG
jgi:hypothetical protein